MGAPDQILSLDGSDWTFWNTTMTQKHYPAKVPGQAHTDLMMNKIIGNPYYGTNQVNYKWVAMDQWTYFKTFTVSSSMMAFDKIQLVAEGLDTVANVTLNGKLLWMNDNMFQRNRMEVKSLLRTGSNEIMITFASKPIAATKRAQACQKSTSGQCPGDYPNPVQHGFNSVNYLRTEPCSFSWDWGPAYSPVGIWHSIYLHGINVPVVRDVLIFSNPVKVKTKSSCEVSCKNMIECAMCRTDDAYDLTSWNVTVSAFIDGGITDVLQPMTRTQGESFAIREVSGSLQVKMVSTGKTFSKDVTVMLGQEMQVDVDLAILSGIKAWYPNKYGDQPLYEFEVMFSANGMTSTPFTFSHGFRLMELVQDPLPRGRSFYVRVNGLPIWVKGSNWIPADAFESRVTRDSLVPLFVALQESNQNMIRNWGGGIYQHNFFYELADIYGIMIWEDFMWACAQYAVPKEYLMSSTKEVKDQVRRLQHHSSIAVWAGNNENGCGSCPTCYSELYFGVVLNNVRAMDRNSRPSVVSSPSAGDETEAKPCGDSYSQDVGDIHSYEYGTDCWDVRPYVRARMVTEFGLQSWPSFETLKKTFPKSQWDFNSPLINTRQHHPNGQKQILAHIDAHYNRPSYTNSTLNFKYMLFLTQIYQAYCYKTEVEHFRRIRQECSSSRSGCTMGAMYWQTNDIWPGASWSSIEYGSRYKVVQYYSKKFYDKFILSGYLLDNNYTFYYINEEVEQDNYQVTTTFEAYSWVNGFQASWKQTYSVNAQTSQRVFTISVTELLSKSKCQSVNDCVLVWKTSLPGRSDPAVNYIFLGSPKDSMAKDPQLKITKVMDTGKMNSAGYQIFNVEFTASSPAAFVWLETSLDGYFSDNGMLVVQANNQVDFLARTKTTAKELQQTLNIYSLFEAGGFKNHPSST